MNDCAVCSRVGRRKWIKVCRADLFCCHILSGTCGTATTIVTENLSCVIEHSSSHMQMTLLFRAFLLFLLLCYTSIYSTNDEMYVKE